MRTDVTLAASDESADAAWERLRASGADYSLVVDDGIVVGVVSAHDLSGPAGGQHRRMGRTVGNLMHRDVVTAGPDTTVARAAALMRKRRVGCLPILARRKLIGVVTTYELLGLLAASVRPGGPGRPPDGGRPRGRRPARVRAARSRLRRALAWRRWS